MTGVFLFDASDSHSPVWSKPNQLRHAENFVRHMDGSVLRQKLCSSINLEGYDVVAGLCIQSQSLPRLPAMQRLLTEAAAADQGASNSN